MSFPGDQSLVDTMLLLEAGLDAIDERFEMPATDEVAVAVGSLNETYIRLANRMRELTAALGYSLKVNKEVAALQNECGAQLIRMFDALEKTEGPDSQG